MSCRCINKQYSFLYFLDKIPPIPTPKKNNKITEENEETFINKQEIQLSSKEKKINKRQPPPIPSKETEESEEKTLHKSKSQLEDVKIVSHNSPQVYVKPPEPKSIQKRKSVSPKIKEPKNYISTDKKHDNDDTTVPLCAEIEQKQVEKHPSDLELFTNMV